MKYVKNYKAFYFFISLILTKVKVNMMLLHRNLNENRSSFEKY